MPTISVDDVIEAVEFAVNNYPAVTAEIKLILGADTSPTAAQFTALRAKVAAENFVP
jgi:hypothetical protein